VIGSLLLGVPALDLTGGRVVALLLAVTKRRRDRGEDAIKEERERERKGRKENFERVQLRTHTNIHHTHTTTHVHTSVHVPNTH
jgi:hypothetical protein